MSKCATAAGTAKRTARCNTFQIRFRQRLLQSRNLGETTTLIEHPLFHDVTPYTCEARPWGNPEQPDVAWWATHRYSLLVWHLRAHSQRCNAKGRCFARSCCNEVGRDDKEYISMDLAMAEKGVKQRMVYWWFNVSQHKHTKTPKKHLSLSPPPMLAET